MKQNIINEKEFSVIILAAGKSERLGFPKWSLSYDDTHTFLEQILSEYIRWDATEIILVINAMSYAYLKECKIKIPDQVKVVINEYPEWHRFYSLKIGAKALSEIYPVFVHNVDNPFVNHQVLKELFNHKEKADYISPEFEGKGGHPVLLSEQVVQEIRSMEENQMHLKEFLNQFSKMKVRLGDKNILVNINSMEDYHKYFD